MEGNVPSDEKVNILHYGCLLIFEDMLAFLSITTAGDWLELDIPMNTILG